ncbi:DUF4199 domain-containing protein [Lewinella sp. IMCC34191]|uniref:DUF4199 domain-containing protein n=1 Tax=Lewinella sp. IMCC34191 TaxID=2259172 RepID=UPI000E21FA09|nr:DUF4199 domain-containing protein [Lewinella sp. IMCC34191]
MHTYRIEIKWGVVFTLMMLAWVLLERLVGLHDQHVDRHAIYTNFVAIPSVLIYCLALRDKREYFYGGTMTYKQGFITGAIVTAVVVLLSPLAQYITHTIISPDYFSNVAAYAVRSGATTQAEAEAYFRLDNYLIQSAVGALIMGLLTTAIVALFFRKHPEEVIGEPIA